MWKTQNHFSFVLWVWNADFPTKFQKFLPIYSKSSNILVFLFFSNEFASFPIFSNTKISSVQCHSLAWLSSPIVSPNKKALVVTIEGVQSRDLGVRTCTLVCKSCCSFVLSTYRTMKSEVRAPPKAVLASWNKLTKDILTVAPMYHQNARTERLAGGRPPDFGQDFGQEWVIRVTTSYVFWHPRVVFACI